MAEGSFDYLYKIIVVGDECVGKTAMIRLYLNGNMPASYIPTIGVEFGSKLIT